jgi:carboxymethylenebutenolidase
VDTFQQYLVEEFLDDHRARRMSRRAMLRRITLILGSAAAATAWLQSRGMAVSAEEAAAAVRELAPADQADSGVTVSPDDPALVAGTVTFTASDRAELLGYMAKPTEMGQLGQGPSVLVIHENRGLLEHYKDVARRFAKEGFVALAIDLVSREGGTDSLPDQAAVSAALAAAGPERHVGDMSDAIGYLTAQAEVLPGGVGVTGYCFGGGMCWRIAVEDQNVAAAAPYYGSAPPLEKVPQMRAAVLGIYAELDERINAGIPTLEEALRHAGKTYKMKIYPGADHAFFNDMGARYHTEAAADAWAETLAWLRAYLPS